MHSIKRCPLLTILVVILSFLLFENTVFADDTFQSDSDENYVIDTMSSDETAASETANDKVVFYGKSVGCDGIDYVAPDGYPYLLVSEDGDSFRVHFFNRIDNIYFINSNIVSSTSNKYYRASKMGDLILNNFYANADFPYQIYCTKVIFINFDLLDNNGNVVYSANYNQSDYEEAPSDSDVPSGGGSDNVVIVKEDEYIKALYRQSVTADLTINGFEDQLLNRLDVICVLLVFIFAFSVWNVFKK